MRTGSPTGHCLAYVEKLVIVENTVVIMIAKLDQLSYQSRLGLVGSRLDSGPIASRKRPRGTNGSPRPYTGSGNELDPQKGPRKRSRAVLRLPWISSRLVGHTRAVELIELLLLGQLVEGGLL